MRLDDDQLRGRRATAQWLHQPSDVGAIDVVRHLLAVQAQDATAAPLALRARAAGLTVGQVDAARLDRSVVRTWGPRSTLHLVAAEDLPWLLTLVRGRDTGSLRRLAQEGVGHTPQDVLAAVDRALSGQGPLSKAELGERLRGHGLPARGQAIVHAAGLAARHGRVVLGPDRAGRATYVHAADWLGAPVPLTADRGTALAELVRRYLRAHGPADPADLAAWSGLPLREVRAGWRDAADSLVEVDHAGTTLWRLRGPVRRPAPVVRLLPAFDEYLLGWRSRDLVLTGADPRLVHPGGGILRPVVVVAGRIVATWSCTSAGAGAVRVVPFRQSFAENVSDVIGDVSGAITKEVVDIGRFLGRTLHLASAE